MARETDVPYGRKKINRVGDRLRRARERGEPMDGADLEVLDAFRAWHRPTVIELRAGLASVFHDDLRFSPGLVAITGRPLKTHEAIIAKLVREKTRLSTMQDIAGARIVVPQLGLQEAMRGVVKGVFYDYELRLTKDCVETPDRWGYRAVVRINGRWAEIQIRTSLQDSWAQTVERVDQVFGFDLKHGRGPAEWLEWLHKLSDAYRDADLGQPFQVPPSPAEQGPSEEENAT